MKKVLCWLLIASLLFCFAACGTEKDDDKDAAKTESSSAENTGTEIPETTAPITAQFPKFSIDNANVVEDKVAFTIVNMTSTDDVTPPNPASYYTHYQAPSGSMYVAVMLDVKNLGTTSVRLDELLSSVMTVDQAPVNAIALAITEDGGDLENNYYIGALETVRAYYLYLVPENYDLTNLPTTFITGGTPMINILNANDFADRKKTVAIGDTIEQEDVISATLQDVYVSDTLYPPVRTGYYSYFEAAQGKTFLIVKMKVKNLKGNDMGYDSIAGMSCIYNGKYRYSAFPVFEEDGGSDLSNYTNIYALSPLSTNTVYFLFEIPEEAANGPIEISMYIGQDFYTYQFK